MSVSATQGAWLPRPRRMFVYLETSERTGQLSSALAKAKTEFTPIERDTEADWGKFASLNSMLKATTAALCKNDLVVTQEYAPLEDTLYVVTVLSHGESDQWRSSVLPIQQTGDADEDAAYQTRARRQAYAAILCLAPENEQATEKRLENAGAKAASQSWAEQFRMAKDAIANATSVSRVTDVMSKVREKADSGAMDPHHASPLEELAVKRTKELAAAAVANKPRQKQEAAT